MKEFENKQIGWDSKESQRLLQEEDKEAFKNKYFKGQEDQKVINEGFVEYKRQKLKAFKKQQGAYTEPTVNSLGKTDQFFYNKYKKHYNSPSP